ncbi:UDP-N-acetylmuramate dehydrogenase, partial [Balneolaceae bacterium ANBcel3]|nr:UDP-N-acetylmuramate dehydrogenase [Balneolaceae bacterium ANBcel3]
MFNRNVQLQPLNTFGISAITSLFAEIKSEEDLLRIMDTPDFHENPRLILGGGSNVLFTDSYQGLVVKMGIPGIQVIQESPDYVLVEAGAGVCWDELVAFCVENNWGGIENLSMIPGLAGAAPIQNIGAYGVELKDTFHSLKAIHIHTGSLVSFSTGDCHFAYRDSIFKQKKERPYIITRIVLKLNKKFHLNLEYGLIKEVLKQHSISQPGLSDVRRAIMEIRASKLPNPSELGNAGSFFKNPVMSASDYNTLKEK